MMQQEQDLNLMLFVFPRHEQDISDIFKYCNEHKIIIVPRGAGSGFTGGHYQQMEELFFH